MSETTNKKKFLSTKDMVMCALCAALIVVCSWISIPAAVPFTLQTFGVCVATGLLGTKRGSISVIVYIILGLVGLPVFSGFKGGPAALFGMTGGYIIGFIFTALIVGLITSKFGKSIPVLALSMVLGIAICYVFGTAWFMIVYASKVEAISLAKALSMCVIPFIIPDIIKIVLATVIVKRLSKVVD